jgi:hypothetical protein
LLLWGYRCNARGRSEARPVRAAGRRRLRRRSRHERGALGSLCRVWRTVRRRSRELLPQHQELGGVAVLRHRACAARAACTALRATGRRGCSTYGVACSRTVTRAARTAFRAAAPPVQGFAPRCAQQERGIPFRPAQSSCLRRQLATSSRVASRSFARFDTPEPEDDDDRCDHAVVAVVPRPRRDGITACRTRSQPSAAPRRTTKLATK